MTTRLKSAVWKDVCGALLLAALVAGGHRVGYRIGLATTKRSRPVTAQAMTEPSRPHTASEAMQSAAVPSCSLGAATQRIALFETLDVRRTVMYYYGDSRRDRGEGGKFNYNIGYQF